MLIEQFISFIEAEKRFSTLTVEAYSRDMNQFADYIRDTFEIDDLTKVETTMVKSYIVRLKEKGQVNRSINRKLSTLRTFYKYCLRENLIEKSPMTGVKALKLPRPWSSLSPRVILIRCRLATETISRPVAIACSLKCCIKRGCVRPSCVG